MSEGWNGVQILDCKGIYLFFENEINSNSVHGINISDHFLDKEEEKFETSQTWASSQNNRARKEVNSTTFNKGPSDSLV